jgi:pantoate--beta-alanine ligase
MKYAETIDDLRAARRDFSCLGLVPTMGYLHDGHLSLVARARRDCGAVAVSIFVNPTQFGSNEDLSQYPRDLPRDLALLEKAGVDLVFAPAPAIVYPPGFATRIEVGAVAELLEGAARPGHFSAVATVVTKLFNIVQPDRAYFGQKDGQQCAVIRQLVRDLDSTVEIVVCDTVRERDGLAMSSRNVHLTPPQRAAAPVLFRALTEARRLFERGERRGDVLRTAMRAVTETEPQVALGYASIADPETLAECATIIGAALASIAVGIGSTRLIDNILLVEGASSRAVHLSAPAIVDTEQ